MYLQGHLFFLMKADMVNECDSLNNAWLTDKYKFKDIKEGVRLARMQRFASLNASLEVKNKFSSRKVREILKNAIQKTEEEQALELAEWWMYNICFLFNL